MNKKTIMVDMDEVLTEDGFLYLLNKYLETDYKKENFKSFRMQEIMPNDQRIEFFKWFAQYNMYDYCSIIPGAKEALRELQNYYHIFIATAYLFPEAPWLCGKFIKDKFDYLYNNFPFLNPNDISFINRKDLLYTFCKIDDNIKNLRNAERKYLFPAYHNHDISEEIYTPLGIEKVTGWEDITKRLIP